MLKPFVTRAYKSERLCVWNPILHDRIVNKAEERVVYTKYQIIIVVTAFSFSTRLDTWF